MRLLYFVHTVNKKRRRERERESVWWFHQLISSPKQTNKQTNSMPNHTLTNTHHQHTTTTTTTTNVVYLKKLFSLRRYVLSSFNKMALNHYTYDFCLSCCHLVSLSHHNKSNSICISRKTKTRLVFHHHHYTLGLLLCWGTTLLATTAWFLWFFLELSWEQSTMMRLWTSTLSAILIALFILVSS